MLGFVVTSALSGALADRTVSDEKAAQLWGSDIDYCNTKEGTYDSYCGPDGTCIYVKSMKWEPTDKGTHKFVYKDDGKYCGDNPDCSKYPVSPAKCDKSS